MNNIIDIHTIFCNLVGDETFLSVITETNAHGKSKKKKNGMLLLQNITTDYNILIPYDTQTYRYFPQQIKKLIPVSYTRLGIKNTRENDNGKITNISFLNSLNILLRPELAKMDIVEQMAQLTLLETALKQLMKKNCQIDKEKNSPAAQEKNKIMISNLITGKVTHDLINYIVNIFEINLIVFDLAKNETILYWCKGSNYPYLNLFKDIHFMTYIRGNYEPLVPDLVDQVPDLVDQVPDSISDSNILYSKILADKEIKYINSLEVSITSFTYVSSWNISISMLVKIIENHYLKIFDIGDLGNMKLVKKR